MLQEQIDKVLPEMRERRTVMPDGRYLIFYEFDDGEEDLSEITH